MAERPTYTPYIPDERDIARAALVVSWIDFVKADAMVPRTLEDMVGFFQKQNSLFLVGPDKVVRGHIAITDTFLSNGVTTKEVGALIVHPEFGGNGVGKALITKMVELEEQRNKEKGERIQLIAFANNASLKAFLDAGFVKLSDDQITPKMLRGCATCPRLEQAQSEGEQCCDTIVIFQIPTSS